jgi:phosphatidyl-myo-inositol dimannoside synthase
MTMKIHTWLPDIFEFKGGIQVYSRFLVQALETALPDAHIHVFLKNDARITNKLEFNQRTKFQFAGRWKSSWLHTPVFAFQVFLAAVQKRPDLIICGHINFSPLALLICKFLKIPYWTVAHGVEAWNIENPKLQRALHDADLILPVSGYTGDRLIKEQKLNPDKIVILPNTFDQNRFQIAPKPTYLLQQYGLKPKQPVILTVARLAPSERYKGYDQIIQALPQIRQIIPDVHYIIVGKGNDTARIEQLIKQLGLQDCVSLAGFIPDEQLCDYYNLCHLFAMPSKGEGFGIVYLEALACGKPVLGGNQDAAIDALCHGKLGALVNPDDVLEIAHTIIEILLGKYNNSLMYQPQSLRQAVIDTFGFEQFQKTLAGYLHRL